MKNAFDQYQLMRAHHLIFGYRGTLSNELITSILNLSEIKLKDLQTPFKKKKSIINILIECLQNILYHSETFSDGLFSGHHCIFLIGKREGEFFIQIGNYVEKSQVPDLKAKLDYVNSLQPEGVHSLYLEILDKGQISAKGGAGLGILRVVKDSGKQIKYEFQPIDNQKAFFCMEIKVDEK
jgi:hypothetical protein